MTLTAEAPDAEIAIYALASAEDGPAANPGTPADATAVPFGAAIYAGDCGDLGEWIVPLGEVAAPDGPRVGDPAAIPVAQGTATVDLPLDEAIDGGYAVVIFEAPTEGAPIVACGEVGGADDDDGALAVGLREVGQSGVAGVAYLAYSAEDPSRTDVSLFVATGLAADAGTAEAD